MQATVTCLGRAPASEARGVTELPESEFQVLKRGCPWWICWEDSTFSARYETSHPVDRYAVAFCASGSTDQSSYSSKMQNLAGWCITLKTQPTVRGILLRKGSHSHQLASVFGPIYFPIFIKTNRLCQECSGFCNEVRMCFCLRTHKLPHGHCCFTITEILGLRCQRAGVTCVIQTHLLMVDILHNSYSMLVMMIYVWC